MKNFIIVIKCDNAAFDEVPGIEVARILRELADLVDHDDLPGPIGIPLRDVNGNRVGSAYTERTKA
jgi:hypothetical protein